MFVLLTETKKVFEHDARRSIGLSSGQFPSKKNSRDLIVGRNIAGDALAHVVNQRQLHDLVQIEILFLFWIEENRRHDGLEKD